MEVQGVDVKQNDQFPYSGLRVLGSVQTGIGVLSVMLGSLDLAFTLIPRDHERKLYNVNALTELTYETIVTLTIASCPLWCGMWFIITGAIGTCVSRMRSHSLLFFRNTFLVLCVLCAALFGPACLTITAYESLLRHELMSSDFRWLIPLLISFLALLELVLAIVSAAMCCCCSSVQLTKVHVLFAAPSHGERPQEVYKIEMKTPRQQSPRQPSPEIPAQKALPAPETEPIVTRDNVEYQGRQLARPDHHGRRVDEPLFQQDSYGKLRNWALPNSY